MELQKTQNRSEDDNSPAKGSKILVGISGGVDSTYAAYSLSERGFEVEGATLLMSDATAVGPAQRTASQLGIALHVIDCRERFRQYVIENLADEYSRARTPNPCVRCNRYVKIELLCEYARENGFDRVSTGHYAGIRRENGRFYIRDAADASKNQSYVLWALTQEQLSLLYMPLEDQKKADIRAAMLDHGFEAAKARESEEICFIPDRDYAGYIERLRGSFPPGDFVDETGHVVGRHRGIIHYTIGQRKGLGLAMNGHVFVTGIDPVSNRITVSYGGASSSGAVVTGLSFQKLPPFSGQLDCAVKIRYAAPETPVSVTLDNDKAIVNFPVPAKAVTPGQSAVFYDGGDILFGGIIDSSF